VVHHRRRQPEHPLLDLAQGAVTCTVSSTVAPPGGVLGVRRRTGSSRHVASLIAHHDTTAARSAQSSGAAPVRILAT
jgi:hypothetical protein